MAGPLISDGSAPATRAGWSSLLELNRYQWFVFLVASSAWMLDCMDQQFFNLARRSAIAELVAPPGNEDPRIAEFAATKFKTPMNPEIPTERADIIEKIKDADIATWSGYSTAAFLVGWAVGGLAFGIMGDRKGRVKTLSTTILIYSLFTGLSALSTGVNDFVLYRFLTGLGVGGVFSVVVALIAETMPDRARPFSLGLLQMLSVIGNVSAALIFMYFGYLQQQGAFDNLHIMGYGPVKPWRIMFLIGILPGLLAVIVQWQLREPEAWKQAMASGKRKASFSELLGNPRWRWNAMFGLMLAIAGVVGLWAIGFYSTDLTQKVLTDTVNAEAKLAQMIPAETARYVDGQKVYWTGITSLMFQIGGFFGMFAFSWITSFTGRRPTFALFFVLAAASTVMVFAKLETRTDILWMVPIMGFCQLALFSGYAIYFPELFPTRLRSTGTSFCYNVGRLLAAFGPPLLATLSNTVFSQYKEPTRWAGVAMCSVFLFGLAALPFLPETKGKPLPEE